MGNGIHAGDVVRLGRHTVFCGDWGDWSVTGCPERVAAILYDPPFDDPPDPWNLTDSFPYSDVLVAFADAANFAHPVAAFGAPAWVFTWDTLSPWSTGPTRPLKQTKHALLYADLARYDRDAAVWGDPAESKSHPSTTFTAHPDGRRLTDLYRESLRWLHAPGASGATGRHRHEKPLAWIRCILGCSAPGGGVLLDLFAGSGVGVIAGDMLGMTVFAVDRDPDAVAAICDRWSDYQSQSRAALAQLSIFGDGATDG